MLDPPTLGEQKSKAAQLGLRQLMQYGIHPHIIACRAEREVTTKVREKISVYANVPVQRVFSMHDLPSIYLLPGNMREAGLDTEVTGLLGLAGRVNTMTEHRNMQLWDRYAGKIGKGTRSASRSA